MSNIVYRTFHLLDRLSVCVTSERLEISLEGTTQHCSSRVQPGLSLERLKCSKLWSRNLVMLTTAWPQSFETNEDRDSTVLTPSEGRSRPMRHHKGTVHSTSTRPSLSGSHSLHHGRQNNRSCLPSCDDLLREFIMPLAGCPLHIVMLTLFVAFSVHFLDTRSCPQYRQRRNRVSASYHDCSMIEVDPSLCSEPQIDDRRIPIWAPTIWNPAVGVGSLVVFGRCIRRIGGRLLTLEACTR